MKPVFDVVRTTFPGPANWYARVTYPDGRTLHSEPWNTHWAAERRAMHMERSWALSKRGDVGNGNTCPLFPEHGNMSVLTTTGKAPVQWCPHVVHDGSGPRDALGNRPPKSRAFWPYHGFEESVAAYMARLDRAIREITNLDLPDLTDLEVQP